MSDEPIEITEENKPSTNKKPNPLVLGFIIVGGLLLALYKTGSFDTANINSTDPVYNAEEQAEQSQKEAEAQKAFDNLGVTSPSQSGVLVTFGEKLNQLQRQLNAERQLRADLEKKNQQKQQTFEESFNKINGQLQEISTLVQEGAFNRTYSEYKSDSDALPDAPLAEQPVIDDFDYKAFGRPVTTKTTTEQDSLGDTISDSFTLDGVKEISAKDSNITPNLSEETDTVGLSVPGGSFVKITNLHGIDCPIGGDTKIDDLFSNIPVTLKVRGIFKGPMHASIDLANAHIIGVCVGVQTTKRARVKVERLSYWDDNGEQQFIPINGYINDASDNSLDIKGTVIETPASDVAYLALSQFLGAFGGGLQNNQFTSTVNSVTGSTTSTLTGDRFRSALGSGIQSSAAQVSQILANKVAATVPVVHVEAGRDLQLFTSSPFTIQISQDEVPLDDESLL